MLTTRALVLVFMVSQMHISLATKCGIRQITIIQNRSEYCVDCIRCPQGFGSVPHCGSFFTKNRTVACETCVDGVSYSESHDHTSCKSCRVCVENEEVIRKCTATSDTECGECKPGYYRSFVYACLKCSPCCQDTQEDDVEPQCLRQGFSRDQACRYTGRNCERLEPTLAGNIVAKTTDTQEMGKSKIPPLYIIGGVALMCVVILLSLVVIFLAYRIQGKAKRDKPVTVLELREQYSNNDNVHVALCSQVELGKPLVGPTKL